MHLLNIVGGLDDICTPPAATPIIDNAASKDKELFRFPTGHIEFSASSEVHEKLWPKVVHWFEQCSLSRRIEETATTMAEVAVAP
ncbi:MAG: hypothetical protein M3270_11250 [Thermoproteota archaeon]|nr:hypothetical protein [Thermoproteota archaeon]